MATRSNNSGSGGNGYHPVPSIVGGSSRVAPQQQKQQQQQSSSPTSPGSFSQSSSPLAPQSPYQGTTTTTAASAANSGSSIAPRRAPHPHPHSHSHSHSQHHPHSHIAPHNQSSGVGRSAVTGTINSSINSSGKLYQHHSQLQAVKTSRHQQQQQQARNMFDITFPQHAGGAPPRIRPETSLAGVVVLKLAVPVRVTRIQLRLLGRERVGLSHPRASGAFPVENDPMCLQKVYFDRILTLYSAANSNSNNNNGGNNSNESNGNNSSSSGGGVPFKVFDTDLQTFHFACNFPRVNYPANVSDFGFKIQYTLQAQVYGLALSSVNNSSISNSRRTTMSGPAPNRSGNAHSAAEVVLFETNNYHLQFEPIIRAAPSIALAMARFEINATNSYSYSPSSSGPDWVFQHGGNSSARPSFLGGGGSNVNHNSANLSKALMSTETVVTMHDKDDKNKSIYSILAQFDQPHYKPNDTLNVTLHFGQTSSAFSNFASMSSMRTIKKAEVMFMERLECRLGSDINTNGSNVNNIQPSSSSTKGSSINNDTSSDTASIISGHARSSSRKNVDGSSGMRRKMRSNSDMTRTNSKGSNNSTLINDSDDSDVYDPYAPGGGRLMTGSVAEVAPWLLAEHVMTTNVGGGTRHGEKQKQSNINAPITTNSNTNNSSAARGDITGRARNTSLLVTSSQTNNNNNTASHLDSNNGDSDSGDDTNHGEPIWVLENILNDGSDIPVTLTKPTPGQQNTPSNSMPTAKRIATLSFKLPSNMTPLPSSFLTFVYILQVCVTYTTGLGSHKQAIASIPVSIITSMPPPPPQVPRNPAAASQQYQQKSGADGSQSVTSTMSSERAASVIAPLTTANKARHIMGLGPISQQPNSSKISQTQQQGQQYNDSGCAPSTRSRSSSELSLVTASDQSSTTTAAVMATFVANAGVAAAAAAVSAVPVSHGIPLSTQSTVGLGATNINIVSTIAETQMSAEQAAYVAQTSEIAAAEAMALLPLPNAAAPPSHITPMVGINGKVRRVKELPTPTLELMLGSRSGSVSISMTPTTTNASSTNLASSYAHSGTLSPSGTSADQYDNASKRSVATVAGGGHPQHVTGGGSANRHSLFYSQPDHFQLYPNSPPQQPAATAPMPAVVNGLGSPPSPVGFVDGAMAQQLQEISLNPPPSVDMITAPVPAKVRTSQAPPPQQPQLQPQMQMVTGA
ncbi:hypothetical protein GQ42DRAFT_152153 [Ramicandelaber brevisporus]|nr:hypothetical protein GQ42DRAFT_152153 [Ramicandelaber brevisporus]